MGSATVQGQLWGTSPQDWAEVIEPLLRPIHLATMEALGPLSGLSLLDAGCGTGLALRLAAERGARVSGLDASAALLDMVRGQLPDADLRVGDIEELPYDDATFDVVTAFNSMAGPLQRVIQLAGEQVVREAFDEVHARYRLPDGSYRQENVFRYVIARKPG